MRTSVTTVVLISLLSGCGSPPDQEEDRAVKLAILQAPEEEEDRPANPALLKLILVRAQVKSIGDVDRNSSVATLEIVHVYCGSAKLKGRSFRDTQMFRHSAGYPASARFEVDEEGIWSLDEREGVLGAAMDRRLPFICRSRKLDDRRHAQHSLLAEAVEKYANAKPEDQPELSAKLAQDATPELCYWMVRTLGESDAKFAGDLLARWRKKPGDLPLRAQIALDEVLCAKERADWFSTPERTALLKSWVTGKADEYHTQRVLSRLDMASQHDQLRGDKAIELVQISTSNKDWRNEDRRNAIWFVGLLARRMVDHQATYEWLFEQMRSNPDLDMRRTAAGVVGSLLLQPKRIQAVEDYLATEEKDATIIKNLRAAVKKAKEADKK